MEGSEEAEMARAVMVATEVVQAVEAEEAKVALMAGPDMRGEAPQNSPC